jgi:hypothetical protein
MPIRSAETLPRFHSQRAACAAPTAKVPALSRLGKSYRGCTNRPDGCQRPQIIAPEDLKHRKSYAVIYACLSSGWHPPTRRPPFPQWSAAKVTRFRPTYFRVLASSVPRYDGHDARSVQKCAVSSQSTLGGVNQTWCLASRTALI